MKLPQGGNQNSKIVIGMDSTLGRKRNKTTARERVKRGREEIKARSLGRGDVPPGRHGNTNVRMKRALRKKKERFIAREVPKSDIRKWGSREECCSYLMRRRNPEYVKRSCLGREEVCNRLCRVNVSEDGKARA